MIVIKLLQIMKQWSMKKQQQPLSLLPLLLLLQLINVLFGSEGSTLGTNFAEIGTAALLGSAGINLLGSALGGLFGSKSQQSANEANIQMQRETNDLNYKMYKEQEAFQREQWQNQLDLYDKMWKQQTEYNDPLAQVQRYRNAGINPLFAMGNISSGEVSTPFSPSAPSAPSSSPAVAPKVEAYDPTGAFLSGARGISDSINSYFSNSLIHAQTENQLIENLTKYDSDIAKLEEIKSRTAAQNEELHWKKSIRGMMREQLARGNEQLEWQVENSKAQRELTKMQSEFQQLQNEWQKFENDHQNERFINEVKEIASRIDVNKATSAAHYADVVLKKAEEAGVKADTKTTNHLRQHLVKQAKAEAKYKTWKAKYPMADVLAPTLIGGLIGYGVKGVGKKGAPKAPPKVKGFR